MDEKIKKLVLKSQQNEITEHLIYSRLAQKTKDSNNRQVLEHIAADELKHHDFLKTFTKEEVQPHLLYARFIIFLAQLLGLSFVLKYMENGEHSASGAYQTLAKIFPPAETMISDEHSHEQKILDMLKEEKLAYAGSIVLGLNDALVELTGALAGLTFALHNSTIIAVTGLITGIAAAMSMAASDYLSSKEEQNQNNAKKPLKSAAYTGVAYSITVLVLVAPYFFLDNVYASLLVMLCLSIVVIFSYTFYISVSKNLSFKKRFLEMAALSLTVAFLSYLAGWIISSVFHIGV